MSNTCQDRIGPSRQKKQCTPHSFSPPYRWGETVYPSLFFPTLQMGRKSGLHSFSPSIRWKSESVPPTLFSHCNKMENNSVPPTLFFPIIEGEKVQRVRNYPYPNAYSAQLSERNCAVCMMMSNNGSVKSSSWDFI